MALLSLGTLAIASLVTPALEGIARARESLSRLLPGVGHLAGTGLAVRPRGTALAVAAITCLVAFASGAILLSASFGETLLRLVRARYPDAVEVSAMPAFDTERSALIRPEVIAAIRRTAGVAALAEQYDSTVLVRGEEVTLAAFESRGSRERLGPDEVAVSSAFARHFGLGAGDSLELATPRGRRRFAIADERLGLAGPNGILYMDLATFDAHWPRAGATSALLYTDGDSAPVIDAIRRATNARQSLFFTANRELLARAEAFAARFDSLLFGVASLALVLGGFAIANLLLGTVAARRRELVLLRTAGAAPNQLAALVLCDAALIAGGSLFGGALLGAAVARPMLEILGAEFGLYVEPHVDVARLALLFAGVAAAVLASASYPALLARRTATLDVSAFG